VWATAHKLNPFPTKPHEFVRYLQYIGETTSSKLAVEEVCNAVAWIHTTAGLSPIIAHSFVGATLEGLLAKSVVKKEPMMAEMLEAIIQDADKSSHLADLRLVIVRLLGSSGFLQFDELIHLRQCRP